jgi:hypothetical protein
LLKTERKKLAAFSDGLAIRSFVNADKGYIKKLVGIKQFITSIDELNLKEHFEIANVYPFEESGELEDVVQVIHWYQHLIYIKLMRVIRGRLEEKTEVVDEYAKDSEGSAKVALIAIDRSIAAWGQIRNHSRTR